jgi:arginine transport system substrate-binding protein
MKTLSALIMISISVNGYALDKINTIHFATEASYPPFESVDEHGVIKGFDIDVVHAICAQLKAQCTISNQAFDSLIPSLQLAKFDAIIGAIAITDARAKVVDFTQAYYQDSVSFVAAKSLPLKINALSLNGKNIGVQSGTTFEQYLHECWGHNVHIKSYASNEEALLDLQSERIDAFLGDTPFIMQWLNQGANTHYHLVGQAINDDKYFGQGDGIAVKKGNKALLNALNQAISTLKKDGTLKALDPFKAKANT